MAIKEIFFSEAISSVLSGLLIFGFVVQMVYYLFFYLKFALTKPRKDFPDKLPGVSVIITARNEAANLERFLPSVLEQNYDNYQVVVVNHASTDETDFVLKRFEQKYKHLYVTKIPYSPASMHTKKLALIIGIKAAKNDILLFTDADCKPVSKNWIKSMVRHFDAQTKIVLGYGGYERIKGLLDKWVRTDTAFIAMQYFGFALRGLPYMGVGRNIAWRKSFFEERGGFQAHFYEPSGSDDIFVNHNGNGKNTKCEFSPDSFTRSIAPGRWKDWILAKRRHYGSVRFYRFGYKVALFLEPFSRIVFLAAVLALFFLKNFNLLPIFILFVRELVAMVTFIISAAKLREKGLWWFYWIYDLIQPFFNLIVFTTKKHKPRWT